MTKPYATLRAELDRGLSKLEAEGRPIDDAMTELLRMGLVLSVAAIGAGKTVDMLAVFLGDMHARFPDAFAPYEHPLTIAPVEGHA